ncbi:hypothetical protein F5148DRAFT_1150172 [Russula earlei]|uniref:Uncharacterized protein n=1 Tax=Russula earlei TaxID=71964 RepID=A0ACC0U5U0_9AGAM|nr:hypothetical protein F5148DRAFT_1150172 [Russula earlei]
MKQTKILVVQGMDVDEGARGMGEVGGDRAEVSSLFLGIEWAMRGNDVERSAQEVSEKRERNDDSWRDDRRGRETRDKGKGRRVGEGREGGGGKCKSWNLRMWGAMASDGPSVFWMVDVLTWGLEKATSCDFAVHLLCHSPTTAA